MNDNTYDLNGIPGEVIGHGYPDWPEDLKSFAERKAYQRGVAHARAVAKSIPIDMVLYCPNCGEQHIDEADLDAMCDLALGRIVDSINDRVDHAFHMVRTGFVAARDESNRRHHVAIREHRIRLIDAGFWWLFLQPKVNAFPSVHFDAEFMKQHAKGRFQ